MTKLGNETIKLNKEWVGVDELIGAAVRRLKRYRPAQVIHIYLLEEECDLFVDAPLLEQAIFNILDNASKYSNYKNIEVHVHYQDHLEIAIHDEGYGFIDKEIPFVFDKFFRGEQSKNDKNGMGLGLSIVKAIMTAHESEIIISKSLVTSGSCVTLRFSQFEINAKGDIDG
nr:ATP-binding protein [Acinetobacter sedimenti]